MWLNVQSDSKKKCLILTNLWTKSFWGLDRIVTNDSMILGLWGSEYIYKRRTSAIFRVKTKWIDSVKLLIDPDIRNMSHMTMKNNTIQTMIESIQNPQDEDWYDSD